MNAFGSLVGMLLVFGFVVILFLIFRAVVLWYWKVDKLVELTEDIRHNVRRTGDLVDIAREIRQSLKDIEMQGRSASTKDDGK